MIAFQKRNDATVFLISDNQVNCDTMEYDSYPVIISYPQKINTDFEVILKMITDTSEELAIVDRIIYKYINQVRMFNLNSNCFIFR